MKSKYRGPPKLTSKTAEATGYSERRRIVAEKSEISAAAVTSPLKYNSNTEALQRLAHDFYREKNAFTWCCLGPSVDFILMLTGETALLTSLVSIYIVHTCACHNVIA